ncbi:MAG TPA: translation initiation factor [Steroidobacteraceae bacterium]|nr:translation initiation factor [Steroidobacteraceae bacterium]HRX88831.1 translation initiation factor [Steroidobacteraceae bacterium]
MTKSSASPTPPAIRIGRQTAGRGGKGVTVIVGVPLPGPQLEALCTTLKRKCGCGGAVRAGTIEIQGDQRDRLVAEMLALGYRDVKKAGG